MATDVKKMMDDFLSAMNSHDTTKAVSFWADDCIYENWAFEIVKHGKKELTDMINSMQVDYPDLKYELKSIFATGDWVGFESVISGTFTNSSLPAMPAIGKTFSVRAASIIQLRKGKISRLSDYFNQATLLQQIGVMPMQSK